jgi:zinc transport system substrate-binding protein
MKRILQIVAVVMVLATTVTVVSEAKDIAVVASTSWVGAIAEAAGATSVTVLAPLDLRHPPEYDFKPGDVKRAMDADYILWGGYEPFMKKLQAVAGLSDQKMVHVNTDNIPDTLKQQTRELAGIFGTQREQQQWEILLDNATQKILNDSKKKGLTAKKAVVHKFLEKYAEWMGLTVVGTFGGGEELTPVKMAELIRAKPDIVVDNWHNSQGEGIASEAGVARAVLINFPGHGGTRTILDVLRYNARQLGL